MKPIDDNGHELDSIFTIEPRAGGCLLILESRGGAEGGPRAPRNADYAKGLELLLNRLGKRGATLTDIEVFSRVTQDWPVERRRIEAPSFPVPIDLSSIRDLQAFRHQLGSASAALGRKARTGGNSTKRLRFTLEWPFAVGRRPGELERLLAGGSDNLAVPVEENNVRKPVLEEPTDDPDELARRVQVAKDRMERGGRDLPPPPAGSSEVEERIGWSKRYVRDPNIVAWVLIVANGTCEVCDTPAPFIDKNGDPFLEVHHVRPLGEGGPDVTENAVAACPNCHRRLHFGEDRDACRVATIAKIERLEDYPMLVDQTAPTEDPALLGGVE